MASTFFSTRTTGLCVVLNGRTQDLHIGAGATRTDGAGCDADVGAIEVQSNALAQIGYHILSEASVGTRRAGLSACVAFLYALEQSVCSIALDVWVSDDHFS